MREADHNTALPTAETLTDQQIIAVTQRWLDEVVVGLNLCPFAKRELTLGRVCFEVSKATTEEALLHDLAVSLFTLEQNDQEVETTLLIHPRVLQDFAHYNEFLSLADKLIEDLGFAGILQLASFHPDYQFAETLPTSAENYSNRSPFPLLHLLREHSVAHAVDAHPDIASVPTRNIALLQQRGREACQAQWLALFDDI